MTLKRDLFLHTSSSHRAASWAPAGLLAVFVLAGMGHASPGQAPRVLSAPLAGLASDLKNAAKTGSVIDDPAATDGHAFEPFGGVNMSLFNGALPPGWYLLDIRVRSLTAAPPSGNLNVTTGYMDGTVHVSYQTSFFARDLAPDGSYADLVRTIRLGSGAGAITVAGGWNGLVFDSIKLTPITASLILDDVRPQKLLYGTADAGVAEVNVFNPSSGPIVGHLTVAIESGLSDHAVIYDHDVSVPPSADPFKIEVPIPPQPAYGHALVATLAVAGATVGIKKDYFYVSDHPVEIGHLGGMGIGNAVYNADDTPAFVDKMRRHYFPLYEIDFWAPDDTIQLTPPDGKDRWWSGQNLARTTTESMKQRIDLGHAQGMKVLGYTDLSLDFGFRAGEFFRQHPDLALWDANNGAMAPSVSAFQQLSREDDAERFDPAHPGKPNFNSSGCWAPATGNPALVDAHIAQLLASIKTFDWDGFRYDDNVQYDAGQVDLLGRRLPYPGFSNPVILARLRSALEKAKPGFIYGHNMEWRQGMDQGDPALPADAQSYPGDYYTEFLRDGGLHMQERYSSRYQNGHTPWTQIADDLNRVGVSSYRFGGAAYNILPVKGVKPTDAKYLTALNLAGMSHMAYDVTDDQVGYMRLACRYCDLLYGSKVVTVADPDAVLKVDSGATPLWWHNYVRYREVKPGHRIYYVHLINPSPNDKIGGTNLNAPDPVTGVKLAWTLPAGWRPSSAYAITGDGGSGVETTVLPNPYFANFRTLIDVAGQDVTQQSLPVANVGGSFQVTLPSLQIWTMVALDCTGPTTDIAPSAVQTLPPAPGPWVPASPVAADHVVSVNDFPAQVWRANAWWVKWLTDDPTTTPAPLPVVQDPGTDSGQALSVAGPFKLETGFSGVVGGTYRVSIRVRCTQAPPAGAQISFVAHNAPGKPDSYSVGKPFDLSDLTPAQGWRTYSNDIEYAPAPGGLTIDLTGGCPGLLIDYLSFAAQNPFPDSKQLARDGAWPETPLAPHTGKAVWFGEGFYADNYKLADALNSFPGVTVDDAKQWFWTNTRGFHGPTWNNAGQLAGYDLVVIGNIDLRSLYLQQRGALQQYVNSGGSVLFLGGPYGFGRGFWQESDVAESIFPVTMHNYDLQPVGIGHPVALKPAPGGLFAGLQLGPMTNLWQHQFTAKPNATVQMTSGNDPAIVTWEYGKGRVAAIGITPLGDDSAVPTAWRKSPDWVKVMAKLTGWLLRE